jgi:hypothetical protein
VFADTFYCISRKMSQEADPHNVWVCFHKTTATVMDGHRQYYASCLLCQGAPSPKDLKDYDTLARLSGEAKRSEADKLSLLVGKTVSLWRHLKLQCKEAEESVNRIDAEISSALHRGSRVKRAVPDLIDSVAASAERP